ncbi:MAG: hypothetical protein ACTSYA_01985 [Candidatus Kariarchaeaceae archaeon]
MKQVILKLIIPLSLILLICSMRATAENVKFERSIDDLTIDFSVDYNKYLKNNEETMLHVKIFVINYPDDMTICYFSSVVLIIAPIDGETFSYHTEEFFYSHDFMVNPEFILSATYTPAATSEESPDDYFADSIISLSFDFMVNMGDGLNNQYISSPNLALGTLASTDPSTTDTEPIPTTSDTPSKIETFFENYGLIIAFAGIAAVVIGLIVLLSKSAPHVPPVSTQSLEFSKKRSSEKKSRRDRKKRN